jgi:hypothetical protein
VLQKNGAGSGKKSGAEEPQGTAATGAPAPRAPKTGLSAPTGGSGGVTWGQVLAIEPSGAPAPRALKTGLSAPDQKLRGNPSLQIFSEYYQPVAYAL